MATIYIDNQPHQVKDGQNLLQACLGLGFSLPYFCWHPAMHSVGACRQCAVKLFRDEKDTRGQIVMSCMPPVRDGMRLSIDDAQAAEFRRGVIEMLMVGHPHDCPVCDEGGECHLQDMTVMTGHDYRRYRFNKRTFVNQDLGPFVAHEMNRCIQCYRCVRFYCDYAGGRDFGVQGWHNHLYFGRFASGVLQSEFSGNLVEVCPTGVFTDKTRSQHYTRKWDLTTAPSVCTNCSVGCNTIPGERYGTIRVIHNRYNGHVNRYFLCDRGRYGYEFTNDPNRPSVVELSARVTGVPGTSRATGASLAAGASLATGASPSPAQEPGGLPRPPAPDPRATSGAGLGRPAPSVGKVPPAEAANVRLVDPADEVTYDRCTYRPPLPLPDYALDWVRPGKMVGIGSSRASVESNFALRQLVGEDRFCSGMSQTEHTLVHRVLDVLKHGPAPTASLRELDLADAVLVLGEDLTNTAPMAALAVRQASLREPLARAIRDVKVERWQDQAVRRAIGSERGPIFILTPQATKLDEVANAVQRLAPADIARFAAAVTHELDAASPAVPLEESLAPLAHKVAQSLLHAQKPVIAFGTSLASPEIIDAAAALAAALVAKTKPVRLFGVVPHANSLGLAMLAPRPTAEALPLLQSGQADTIVVLENDLYRAMPAAAADALLAAARQVVVLDCIRTATTARADVLLPASSVFESDGTFVNNEGRAQRFCQVFVPPGHIRESWRWLADASSTQEAGKEEAGGLPRPPADDRQATTGAGLGRPAPSSPTPSSPTPSSPTPSSPTPSSTAPSSPAAFNGGSGATPPEWDTDGVHQPAQAQSGQGLEALHAQLATTLPALAGVREVVPPQTFRIRGQRLPRQHHRFSGRTATTANVTVHEPHTPGDVDSPLSFSMEGYRGSEPAPSGLITRFWAPGWNSNNSLTRFQEEIGGPLRGGDPGRRLIEPQPSASAAMPAVPAPFQIRKHKWLLLCASHIFGSEELSVRTPGVAQRSPQPYVALSEHDALTFRMNEGTIARVEFEGTHLDLPVRIYEELPNGTALLPVGLPGLPALTLPAWASITPASAQTGGRP